MAFDQLERPTLAARLDAELRHAHPATVLESAVEAFGDKLALVSSFGAESAVLLHMISKIKPDVPVLFLDTGMLFGQTLDYRKNLAAKLGLTDVRDLRPAYNDLAVADPNAKLWQTDTDACCEVRKVIPLDKALVEFDAWITGRKRFQGGERTGLEFFQPEPPLRLRVNPLAHWRPQDVVDYMDENALPRHPLVARGYPSIGCEPCTRAIKPGEPERAGRWWWENDEKRECGLHVAEATASPIPAPSVA